MSKSSGKLSKTARASLGVKGKGPGQFQMSPDTSLLIVCAKGSFVRVATGDGRFRHLPTASPEVVEILVKLAGIVGSDRITRELARHGETWEPLAALADRFTAALAASDAAPVN
jgi:hypothetical protein